jgi:hypothetical protein
MKKLYTILLLFVLVSCEDTKREPFVGYVVGKEYSAEHMCHSDYEHTIQAGFTHVHTPHVHPHHHHMIEAEYILHVANISQLRHVRVDKSMFNSYKMLDKITINN